MNLILDGPMNLIIDSLADCLLSIESAKLEWKVGSSGVRQIYGDININGGIYGNALYLYNRTAGEAEESSNNLMTLTLCGPRQNVNGEKPTFLYVDLHQPGVGPLIQERVPLNLREKGFNNPFEIVATSSDGSCALTVYMTILAPACLAATELLLLQEDDTWLVSGTVSAVQKLSCEGGDVERTVLLFSRPESDPARALPHVAIPLDRLLAVAPMERDHDRVRKLRILEDPIEGRGSSIAINVDLKLVMDRGGDGATCCFLSAAPKFEVKGVHQVGTRYEEEIESFVTGGDDDSHDQRRKLSLKVSLTTLHHLYPNDIRADIKDELLLTSKTSSSKSACHSTSLSFLINLILLELLLNA